MWENIDKSRWDTAYYSVMEKQPGIEGMDALRAMFPEGTANELNVVLFSTSGVHGTYNTIEEVEDTLNGKVDEDGYGPNEVTFLIVHPRIVALRYGLCHPKNQDDIDYLKRLRQSSHEALLNIGMPTSASHPISTTGNHE